MDLRIQLLGGFEVRRGEERLDPLLSRQARTLLKVLLLAEGRPVLADQLIEILWPEDPFARDLDRARRSLRARVYEVRRVLEPASPAPYRYRYLQTVPGGYRFSPESVDSLDVAAFWAHWKRARAREEEGRYAEAVREYEAALELYRGDLLPEDRYEEWAQGPREELQRAHLQALMGAAEAYARQGKYRRALELGEAALARAGELGEVREDLYRRLMLYHAQLGNLAGAKRLYERCRRELAERWGLEPHAQTQKLYERLWRGEPADADVGVESRKPYPPPTPEPLPPGPGRLPFVGREEPYSRLVRRLIEVSRGRARGGLFVLEGEAGVGKTRLAREALAYARRELQAWVLAGAGGELAAKRPYQALRQALQGALRFLPKGEREKLARCLARLRPGGAPGPGPDPDRARSGEAERLRLFWDLGERLLGWARTAPLLVLFFDDLPRVDPSTQEFLAYLLGQLEWEGEGEEVPLVVLGTARLPCEPEGPGDLWEGLRTQADRLELAPLSGEAIVELLRQQAPSLREGERRRLAEALRFGSGGNPLALTALLQELVEGEALRVLPGGEWVLHVEEAERRIRAALPRELRALLEARLARLDPQDRRLLELLSVLGDAAEREVVRALWERLAGEGEWALVERLGRLEGELLLVGEGPRYRFAHEKIGEVLYEGLSGAERRWLHAHVAEVLRDVGEGEGKGVPPRVLGHHYARAGRREEAVPLLLEALREALEEGRNTEAVAIASEAEEALSQGEASRDEDEDLLRFWVELEQGRVQAYDRLGRREEQAEALARLLPRAERLGPAAAAEAYRLQAAFFLVTGDPNRAREAASEGVRYAFQTGDRRLRCRALLQLALTSLNAPEEAEALLDRAERELPPGATWEAAQLFYYRGTLAWRQEKYAEGERAYRRALALMSRGGKGRVLLGLGNMRWAHGDYKQAIEAYEEALRQAREAEDLRTEAHALGSLGMVWRNLGEYEKAEKFLRQALAHHRRLGDKEAQGLDLNSLGWLALELGAFEEAEAYLQEALRLFEELDWPHGKAVVLHNLGQLAWRRGRARGQKGKEEQEQGLARMREALDLLREIQEVRNRQEGLRDLGEALLERQEFSEALELFHEALGICQALKLREGEMVLRADQSRAYLGLRKLREAETASEQALALLQDPQRESSPWAVHVWFARFRVLEAQGRREEARKALDRARKALEGLAERLRDPQKRSRFLQAHPLSAPIREACRRYDLPVPDRGAAGSPPPVPAPEEEEAACYERLRRARWPDGVRCPSCGSGHVQAYGRVRRTPERRYLCRACGKAFSDRTGTVFAHSNLPLSKLYHALHGVAQREEGSSEPELIKELQKSLGVSRRTAALWAERLRRALREDDLARRLVQLQREPHRP